MRYEASKRGSVTVSALRRLCVIFALAASHPAQLLAEATSPSQSAAAQSVQIEEVVVTARKVEESAQVVPTSIVALSASALESAAVFNVTDLQSHVPGLAITPDSQGGNALFAIRAAKQATGTTGGIATYIDDVPMASTFAVANSLFDLNSVSVLKGPQGTLFGVNTTGGAVVFRPNKPSDHFEAYAEVGAGNYSLKQFEGMVNVPVNDALQLRLAAHITDRPGGYIKNVAPVNGNTDLETDKHQAFRISARLKLSSALTNDFVGDYFHEDDQGPQGVPVAFNSSGQLLNIIGLGVPANGFFPGSPPIPGNPAVLNLAAQQLAYGNRTVALSTPSAPGAAEPTSQKATLWGIANTTNFDVNDSLSFKNTVGYRHDEITRFANFSGTAIDFVTGAPDVYKNRQLTEELAVHFNSREYGLRGVGGVYLSELKGDVSYAALNFWYLDPAVIAASPGLNLLGLPQSTLAVYNRKSTSRAVYGQVSYDLSKELTATFGLRYTWDKGEYSSRIRGGTGTGSFFVFDPSYALAPCNVAVESQLPGYDAADCSSHNSANWHAPSWVFTLEDHFVDRSMVYFTTRGGYQGGGFNDLSPQPVVLRTFNPEKVVDFETGLKSDWRLWGRPVRTNIDAFFGRYSDMQREQNWQYISGPLAGQGAIAVFNAGSATFYGTDAELSMYPTDDLELSASWTRVKAAYNSFVIPAIPNTTLTKAQDLSGATLALTPKDTLTLTANYTWPLPSNIGRVSTEVSGYHRSQMTNTDIPGAAGSEQFDNIKAFWTANLTLDWKNITGSHFDGNLWMKNAFNKLYSIGNNNQYGSFGVAWSYWGEPRTFGANIRYSF